MTKPVKNPADKYLLFFFLKELNEVVSEVILKKYEKMDWYLFGHTLYFERQRQSHRSLANVRMDG